MRWEGRVEGGYDGCLQVLQPAGVSQTAEGRGRRAANECGFVSHLWEHLSIFVSVKTILANADVQEFR